MMHELDESREEAQARLKDFPCAQPEAAEFTGSQLRKSGRQTSETRSIMHFQGETLSTQNCLY